MQFTVQDVNNMWSMKTSACELNFARGQGTAEQCPWHFEGGLERKTRRLDTDECGKRAPGITRARGINLHSETLPHHMPA